MTIEEKIKEAAMLAASKLKPGVLKGMRFLRNNDYKEVVHPEYWDGYNRAIKDRERILVHSEIDAFPSKLFSQNSPNQSTKEKDYISETYEPVTLPVYMDYLNTIKRALADNNWSVEYAEDAAEFMQGDVTKTFQDYVETKIPVFKSLESWMKSVLIDIKAKDPEGVIVVKSNQPLDENGNVSSTELNAPDIYYYECNRVLHFSDDYLLIDFTDYSASKLKIAYEYYDKDALYFVKQINEDSKEIKFEITLIDEHNYGKIPATKLKGVPKVKDNKILWSSPFSFVVGILNNVIIDFFSDS